MTSTQRCIEVATAGFDEEFEQTLADFELKLADAADEVPAAQLDAVRQGFVADLRAARDRHVAKIARIFERAAAREADAGTVH